MRSLMICDCEELAAIISVSSQTSNGRISPPAFIARFRTRAIFSDLSSNSPLPPEYPPYRCPPRSAHISGAIETGDERNYSAGTLLWIVCHAGDTRDHFE